MVERPERRISAMLPTYDFPHVDVFICTYSGAAGGAGAGLVCLGVCVCLC